MSLADRSARAPRRTAKRAHDLHARRDAEFEHGDEALVTAGRVTEDDVLQARLNELYGAPDRRLTNAAVSKGGARRIPDFRTVPLSVAYRGPREPVR